MRSPRLRMLGAVALAVALLGAGACSDKKAPTITAPAGFKVFSDDKERFAVAVPTDWELLPTDLEQFDRIAGEIRRRNPELANVLVQARKLADTGVKLFVSEKDGSSWANLIIAPAAKGETFESIPEQSRAKLVEQGATDVKRESSTISGEPATRLSFTLPVKTDVETVMLDEVQYYMLRGDNAVILTLAGESPELATITESLRFG